MAEGSSSSTKDEAGSGGGRGRGGADQLNAARNLAATIIWTLAVIAAILLAVGALMVALDFNQKNGIVSFFVDTATSIDLGTFKDFKPDRGKGADSADTKDALVNWGISAVIYLIAGKVLERVVRP